MDNFTVLVEVTGNQRSGTAKQSGNPYIMFEGWAHLPNSPYPEKVSFYADPTSPPPRAGTYECDVLLEVRDGRISVSIDPRQGRHRDIKPLSAAAKVSA